MGLRTVHYPHILEHWPEIDWFEIISENFMDTDGRPKRILEQVREKYPVVMHGVSMSIGTTDPQDSEYLRKLKQLAGWVNPPWISDHLCWTGIAHQNTHDLLPVPYTEEALTHIVDRIKRVQDFLGRPILLENPSSYLEFTTSEMPEWEFIARMAEEADCGLLLDANNVYVTCYNHRLDPKAYIDAIPADRVIQIHLAGHTNKGTHIVDTHKGEVIDEVWALYRYIISRTGEVSTMVEWDAEIPDFDVVKAEVEKARAFASEGATPNDLPDLSAERTSGANDNTPYAESLSTMHHAIMDGNLQAANTARWIREKPDFATAAQLGVYVENYRLRLTGILEEDLPVLRAFLGEQHFNPLIDAYIESHPSHSWTAADYVQELPAFVNATDLIPPKQKDCAYEITRLEAELAALFHAPETPALTQESLEDVSPDALLSSRLIPRAALSLFAFDYPINRYYNAVTKDEEGISSPEAPEASWLAVFRHEDQLWRLDLEEAEYQLLTSLIDDKTIGEALATMPEGSAADDVLPNLERWFSRWINNGMLSGLPPDRETRSRARW